MGGWTPAIRFNPAYQRKASRWNRRSASTTQDTTPHASELLTKPVMTTHVGDSTGGSGRISPQTGTRAKLSCFRVCDPLRRRDCRRTVGTSKEAEDPFIAVVAGWVGVSVDSSKVPLVEHFPAGAFKQAVETSGREDPVVR